MGQLWCCSKACDGDKDEVQLSERLLGVSDADETASEKDKEAQSRAKKLRKRLDKLQLLRQAREVGAIDEADYQKAIRRLHSITGEDATNPELKATLPESLDWFTALLEVLWPSIRKYGEKQVFEVVQPLIQRALVGTPISCELLQFDLGSASPAFGPMGARKVEGLDGSPDGGVELNLGINYTSNLKVKLSTSAGKVGVQNVKFSGVLFIWFRPFIDDAPIVGGVEIAFVNPPKIDIDFTGVIGGSVEALGLCSTIRNVIDSSVAASVVVPNFITVPLHPSVNVAKLRCPQPEGIARITVKSATNLPSADLGGGVDPFVKLRVGAQTFQTKVVKNDNCPRWDETFEFLVYNKEQLVVIDVYDSDAIKSETVKLSSDLVASAHHLPISRLVKRKFAEVPLVKDGKPLIGEDEDGDDRPPCTLQLVSEWVEIRDKDLATGDRLVSVHISELLDVPKSFLEISPLTVRATVDGTTLTTSAAVAKPGSWTDSETVLQLLRKAEGKSNAERAELVGLLDEKLVAEAVEKKDDEWVLGCDDADNAWWKRQAYVANYGGFPDAKNAAKDERITWASASEDKRVPLATKEELQQRVAHYKKAHALLAWHAAATADMQKLKCCTKPYFEQVLHIKANKTEIVEIDLLDKDSNVLGSTTLTVVDNATGDEADLKGTFAITASHPKAGEASVELSCSVTVKSLAVATVLPASWGVADDHVDAQGAHMSEEWWKNELYMDDWKDQGTKWRAANLPANDRSPASDEEVASREKYFKEQQQRLQSDPNYKKEHLLKLCLRYGALTWGDYDIIRAKLNGEPLPCTTTAETLDWVNLLIGSMWPNIKVFVEKTVRDTVEPLVSKTARKIGASLSMVDLDVKIPKADLGTKPLACNTIQVEKLRKEMGWGGSYEGCVITLHNVSFVSDIDVAIKVIISNALGSKTLNVGVKDAEARMTLKIFLKPMLQDLPLIGAMQVTIPNPPDLFLDFTGLTDKLVDKIPGMNTLVTSTVVNGIASAVCIPNFIVVPLAPHLIKPVELTYPAPVGVLQLVVEKAEHLEAGDTSITGAKSSDSYVILRAGANKEVRTKTVTSLNPVWGADMKDSTKYFVIHDLDQNVEMEVFDADGMLRGDDDSLGSVISKETVLGGGIDLIRAGVPVRALLRQKPQATLELSRKRKDKTCSTATHKVFEAVPVKGEDGQISTLTVSPTLLQTEAQIRSAKGKVSKSQEAKMYLVSFRLNEITGIPHRSVLESAGPVKVRVTLPGPESTELVSNVGGPKAGGLEGAALWKALTKLLEEKEDLQKICQLLDVEKEIVETAVKKKLVGLAYEDERVEFWCQDALAAIAQNKAIQNPQFMQIMYAAAPAGAFTEESGSICPMKLAIVAADDKEIASTVIRYSKADSLVSGPFAVEVKMEKAKGLFGLGKKTGYKGEWTVHGSVSMSALYPSL
eukprot:Sspe_Gene.40488::Locus_19559_Transcript_1_1_Confidence_1.000_Length_4621::g.40488::m.40488